MAKLLAAPLLSCCYNPDAGTLREYASPNHARSPCRPSRSEERTEEHVFFCPICMFYLDRMQRTVCCSHHICQDCAREMLDRIPAFRADYDQSKIEREISCPYCGQENLRLSSVSKEMNARRCVV